MDTPYNLDDAPKINGRAYVPATPAIGAVGSYVASADPWESVTLAECGQIGDYDPWAAQVTLVFGDLTASEFSTFAGDRITELVNCGHTLGGRVQVSPTAHVGLLGHRRDTPWYIEAGSNHYTCLDGEDAARIHVWAPASIPGETWTFYESVQWVRELQRTGVKVLVVDDLAALVPDPADRAAAVWSLRWLCLKAGVPDLIVGGLDGFTDPTGRVVGMSEAVTCLRRGTDGRYTLLDALDTHRRAVTEQ
ncbi:hypothetical protein [Corynebacterium glyciniphilum]|uniref:hypothetical protein n=1 Tax=Corynebacterium glyciniphilum TaxID=1404244 RepID=UPI003FD35F73